MKNGMMLKRLTLNGFKSFADRTEFEFGPGCACMRRWVTWI